MVKPPSNVFSHNVRAGLGTSGQTTSLVVPGSNTTVATSAPSVTQIISSPSTVQPQRGGVDNGYPQGSRRMTSTARLYSLNSSSRPFESNYKDITEFSTTVVINFPAMPEVIQLARRATYRSSQNLVMPDGFHLYQWTEPLTIPIEFRLHADDEYCGSEGAGALISIATKLHTLTLPVTPRNFTQASGVIIKGTVATGEKDLAATSLDPSATLTTGENLTTYYPPVCVLDLMMIGQAGIRCRGFVESVDVKLHGPMLNGTLNGNEARNVPTWAEYSFCFVHNPAYTNNFNAAAGGQLPIYSAMGPDVKEVFYNTVGISPQIPGAIGIGESGN